MAKRLWRRSIATEQHAEPVFFLDTSAFIRAYLPDEQDHQELHALIFDEKRQLIASEIIALEAASAIAAAKRGKRLAPNLARDLQSQVASDLGDDGLVALIPFESPTVLGRAKELVVEYPLGSLDAIHLAVAELQGSKIAGEAELKFISRDAQQSAVAGVLGFETTWN